MEFFLLSTTVIIKLIGTLFFLVLPWFAWRKGCPVRALALMGIAITVAGLLWWPFAPGAEGVTQMLRQMWWLSVLILVCAPLAMLAHYRRKKQTIN